MPTPLSPLERRWLFSKMLGSWLVGMFLKGYRVEVIECGILEKRKSRWKIPFTDGVHMANSRHYQRAAADIVLWKQTNGAWSIVTRTDDPAWQEAGEYWESLDPLCTWGGRFGDGNHISIISEDGRK